MMSLIATKGLVARFLETTMMAFHRNATGWWGGIVAGLIDQASFTPVWRKL
jgi:hypothetical protein